MLNRTSQFLKRQPPWRVLVLASLFLLVLTSVDWLTGPDLRFGFFFLVPIALVTLAIGKRAGLVMAVVCDAARLIMDILGGPLYLQHRSAYGNAIVRLIFFVLTVYLLAAWKEIGRKLEELVRERTAELSAEVAERKHAEESLHQLAMQLADVEDAERRRLAHDIHDAVGQTLSVMKLRMEAATAAQDRDRQRAAMADCLALINTLIGQTRTLTFALHPPMLEDLGLVPALTWHAKQFASQVQTEITVCEYGESFKPPMPISSYLFRSIKELMNNSVKHGHASEIVVSIYWRPGHVRAVVDDNGQGCDPAAALSTASTGLGLAGIRERATTLGGTLELESQEGKGSRAIVQVPCAVYDPAAASVSPSTSTTAPAPAEAAAR